MFEDEDHALQELTTRQLLTELAVRMETRGRPRSTPVAQLGRVCRSSLAIMLPAELDCGREVD
jgi:hypothetical protein